MGRPEWCSVFAWLSVIRSIGSSPPDLNVHWPEMIREDGASINVTCRLPENDQCHAGSWFDLIDARSGVVLARRPCQADDLHGAAFSITPKEISPFGEFKCRHRADEFSAYSVQMSYRFCSDLGQFCAQNSPCDNDSEMKFCVVEKFGIRTCSKIANRDWCVAEERRSPYRYCPINQKCLCSAIFHNYQAVWFRMYQAVGNCPYGVTQPVVQYAGVGRMYEEPFLLNSTDPNLVIVCAEGGPFFNQKVFLTVGGAYQAAKVCIRSVNFTLPDALFSNGTHVYELRMTISRYHFSNRLVVFGTSVNASALDSEPGQAKCELVHRIGEQFRARQWWTRKSNGSARFEESTWRGPLPDGHSWLLKSDHELGDEYECHISITYKSCSPHRKFVQTLTTEPVFVNGAERKVHRGNSYNAILVLLIICSYVFGLASDMTE